MSRLFAALDVDYRQWRMLTLTLMRMRWKTTPNITHAAAKQAVGMIVLGILLSTFGLLGAFLIVVNDDLLLTATVVFSSSMMMVVSDVLASQAGLTSTDDYAILGFRPISSRTFFAVRVTNMMVQSTFMAVMSGWPPVLAYLLIRGPNSGLAVAAAFTIWWSAIFATLAIAGSYATLLRVAGAERVKRSLSYLQMAIGLFTFGGFFLIFGVIEGLTLRNLDLPRSWWLMLFPPAWFAGALAVVTGHSEPLLLALAATAAVMTVAVIAAVRGTASAQYFERLSALASVGPSASGPARTWLPSLLSLSRHEARAAGILIRAQFKHDMTFRMSVLGVLPMVVIYILMGLRGEGFTDPLLRGQGSGRSGMAEFGILMLPSMIWQPLLTSPSFAASWIYFTSPSDRGALLRGARRALSMTIVAPYLLVLGAVLVYFTGAVLHVLVHLVMLWLISDITLQVVAYFTPGLPFAVSPTGRSMTAGAFFSSIFAMIAGIGSVVVLQLFVYPRPLRITVAAAMMIGLSLLLDRLSSASLDRKMSVHEFAG